MNEDEFFMLMPDEPDDSTISEDERFFKDVEDLKRIGEEQYLLQCCDMRDLDLSEDMFDDMELTKENLLAFGEKFKGRLYQEIYIHDTGHSIVIEDLEIYPRGEYNYIENVLYQIDWDKGISLKPDGTHHINWKKVVVHNFKELKEVCGLNKIIKSIIYSNRVAETAFGPLTKEKLNAINEKYGYEIFKVNS